MDAPDTHLDKLVKFKKKLQRRYADVLSYNTRSGTGCALQHGQVGQRRNALSPTAISLAVKNLKLSAEKIWRHP